MAIIFLRAEWRHLAMLNYRVPASLLERLVPAGTELDPFDGAVYVSVVGFLFEKTRILGLAIPFHVNFEEVNLRFYVRRTVGGEVRRGVTFIRELVPKPAIALTAYALYNEPYRTQSMRHRISGDRDSLSAVEYAWNTDGRWTTLRAAVAGAPRDLVAGSEEEFITEHYWGYTRQRDGGTVEYRVEHPAWRVWRATTATLEGSVANVFGDAFAAVLAREPDSAFVADGSAVTVYSPTRISGAAE
jgi:uncharacterized protein YqjF (DUF2071 family)